MQQTFKTQIKGFQIRFATKEDTPLILQMIKQLAEYEKLGDQVVATEEVLSRSLFERRQAHVLIAEHHGQAVGFALFFYNFSTFLGKANLYLEDLYMIPNARGKGFGKAMFCCLARIAQENDCERIDWWCLDWNEPSIAFYKRLGAQAMEDWTVYRLERSAIDRLSEQL